MKPIDFMANLSFIIMQMAGWALIGGIIEFAVSNKYLNDGLITPFSIQKYRKLNWLGSWFVFLLISIINPIGLIVKIICGIIKLFLKTLKFILLKITNVDSI